jgi:hypothetical protein
MTTFVNRPGTLVCGQLAEKLLDHKTWWTPLADGKMVLHVLLGSVCLSVNVYMVDLGGITWVPCFDSILCLEWVLFLLLNRQKFKSI